MRLILFVILCTLVSCHSTEIEIGKKYYAPLYGVIHVQEDFVDIYPRKLFKTRCHKNPKSGHYVCEGPSLGMSRYSVYVTLSPINDNQIYLEYEEPNKFEFPMSKGITLNKMPDSIPLNFKEIAIQFYWDPVYRSGPYRDPGFEEVRLSPDDIRAMEDTTKVFTLREQLWLLFSSGVVDTATDSDRHRATYVRMWGDMYRERYVLNGVIPEYIRDIIMIDKEVLEKHGLR